MREKIVQLMNLSFPIPPTEMVAQVGKEILKQLQDAVMEKMGVIPETEQQLIDSIGAAFTPRCAQIEQTIAEIYECHFTEAQVDELIAFHMSPIGRHIAEVNPVINVAVATAVNEWQTETLRSVEPQLHRLYGDDTAPAADAPTMENTAA